MKPYVTYDEFAKMDFRVGHVVECVRKEDADKLLRLTVDFGEEGKRTILSSLFPIYQPDELQGKDFIFIINLEPRKFLGEESQGMILCADGEKPIPLIPQEKTEIGAGIK